MTQLLLSTLLLTLSAAAPTAEAETPRPADVLVNRQTEADAPYFAEVREIIERIISLPPASRDERRSGATRQQQLFDRLVELGPEAVPAIIEQMDDHRALPTPAISLTNRGSEAFEAFRHYSPEVMVDALAAVLNQLTGENFGFIYNGGTAMERAACVQGWRLYLSRLRNDAG